MSDIEDSVPAEEVEAEVETTEAGSGEANIEDYLKVVLRKALINDGLARGLREASKVLSRGEAQLCVLCESCTESQYIKLVEALCNEGDTKVPLVQVPDAKQLGEWAGLCVLDREGNARKVVGCSCVVVKDWGEDSPERAALLNLF